MRRSVIAIVVLVVTMMSSCMPANIQKKQIKPIVPKEKIALWNGRDFAGWELWVQDENFDVDKVWSVKDCVRKADSTAASFCI